MSTDITATVHEIATDGLPDMDDERLVGRVAFIFDGCIVSGWPLEPRPMKREGLEIDPVIREHAAAGDVLWEGDSDVAHGRMFAGVTHWIEFPVPVWGIARSGTATVDATERPSTFFMPDGFLDTKPRP